jgi:hypothetical protein
VEVVAAVEVGTLGSVVEGRVVGGSGAVVVVVGEVAGATTDNDVFGSPRWSATNTPTRTRSVAGTASSHGVGACRPGSAGSELRKDRTSSIVTGRWLATSSWRRRRSSSWSGFMSDTSVQGAAELVEAALGVSLDG